MSVLLVFDTGQQVLLTGTGLLGRNPEPYDKFPGAQLVSVDDPDASVSGTHLVIAEGPDGMWLMDLASTNGTEVISNSGRARALTAMVRADLPPGARVVLGRRTLRIRRDAARWSDRNAIG